MKLDSPEACSRQFAACTVRGDLEGVREVLDECATFVFDDGRVLRGRDAVCESLAAFIHGRPNLEITIQRVIHAGADLAVLHHAWRVVSSGHGGDSEPAAGEAIQVLRRQPDGSWRLAFDDHGRGQA